MADEARQLAKAKVQEALDLYLFIRQRRNFSGFDVEFMEKVRLIDVDPAGGVIWELDVTPFYGNFNGVMHGGAAGVIFDMGTTVALCPIQEPGYWDFMGGVTRTLNISYLRAIPVNTTIRIHGKVMQHGRTMAQIRGHMESLDGKIVYATVEHHKVHVPIPQWQIDLREEMRAEKRRLGEEAVGRKEKL